MRLFFLASAWPGLSRSTNGECPKCEQALTEEIKTKWLAARGFDQAGNLMLSARKEAKADAAVPRLLSP